MIDPYQILFGATQFSTVARFYVGDRPVIIKGFGLQSADSITFQEEVYAENQAPPFKGSLVINPPIAAPLAVKPYESACCISPCMGPGCSTAQPAEFAIATPGWYRATFNGTLAAQVVTLSIAPASMDVSSLNGCCGQTSGGSGGGSGDSLCDQMAALTFSSAVSGDTVPARAADGTCKRIALPTFTQTPFTFVPVSSSTITATVAGITQTGPNFSAQYSVKPDPSTHNWLTVSSAGVLVAPSCAMLLDAFPANGGTVTHVWGTDAGGECGLFALPSSGGGPPNCSQVQSIFPTATAAAATYMGTDIHGACASFAAPTLSAWCATTPNGIAAADCASTTYVDIDPNGISSGVCAPVLRRKMLPATVDMAALDIASVSVTNAQILAACTGGVAPTLSAAIAYDSQNRLDASGVPLRNYTTHGPSNAPSNWIYPFVIPLISVQPGDLLVLMVNYCYVAPGDPSDGYHVFSDTMTVTSTLPLAGSGFTLAQQQASFHQPTNTTATPTEDRVKVFTATASAVGSGTTTLNCAALISGSENQGAIQTTLYLVRASDGSTVQLKRSDLFANFDATGSVSYNLPGTALAAGASNVLWLSGARHCGAIGYAATPTGVLNNAPGASSGCIISNTGSFNAAATGAWNVTYNGAAGVISQQATGMAFEVGATGAGGGACAVTIYNGTLSITNTNTCGNNREQVNEKVSYLLTDAAMQLPGLQPGVNVLLTQTLGSKTRITRGTYLGTGIEWDGPLATIADLFAGTVAPGGSSSAVTYNVQLQWNGPPPPNNGTVAAVVYPGRLSMRGDH